MKKKDWIAVAILLSGVALITFGVLSGDAGLVMKSAIRICLECIGIG